MASGMKVAPLSQRRGILKLQLPTMASGIGAARTLDTLGDISTCGSNLDSESSDGTPKSPEGMGGDPAFSVGKILGSGSLGVVHMVTRRWDGVAFAAKHVTRADEEQRSATIGEYELLSTLRHDSIICVEELHEDRADLWMRMELCADGSVESWVQHNGAFEEPHALPLVRQLLEGIDFLHSKRIVHRDIKPANLLLQKNATRLKIADFNSAKQVGHQMGSTILLTDRGTALYCAPEIRFNQTWTERVDVWASGLSIFYMLMKRMPFNMDSGRNSRLLRQGTLPEVNWGNISGHVTSLIQLCLAVDMRDRPTAMELLRLPALVEHAGQQGRHTGRAGSKSRCFDHAAPGAAYLASCGLLFVERRLKSSGRHRQGAGRWRPTRSDEWQESTLQHLVARRVGNAARTSAKALDGITEEDA